MLPVATTASAAPLAPAAPSRAARRRMLAYTAAVTILVATAALSERGEWALSRTELAATFGARSLARLDPRGSEQVKTFVYDDAAVAATGTSSPSLAQWAQVLTTLGARAPRAILVDKLFDLPGSHAESDAGAAESFAAAVAQAGAPVYVGGFLARRPIAGRAELAATPLPQAWSVTPDGQPPLPLYGAPPSIRRAFAGVGHLNYLETGHARLAALAGGGDGSPFTTPHLALFARADSPIPALVRDGRGRTLVDLPAPEHLLARTYGMKTLLARAAAGAPVEIVAPGDVVLLLPAFYTGHGDWLATPRGAVPGGLVLMALVDQVLQDRWLRPMPAAARALLIALAAAIGLLLASRLWTQRFWLALAGVAAAWLGAALAAFAFAGLVLPWVAPLTALGLVTVPVMAARVVLADRERQRMEAELRVAGALQDMIFPKGAVTRPGLRVIGKCKPSTECAGDWWGVIELEGGAAMTVVGDAAGHGIPAALVTAMTYAALAALQRTALADPTSDVARSPAAALAFLNGIFCDMAGESWITLFIVRTEPGSDRIVFSNAGHPLPVLLPAAGGGAPASLRAYGNPLGVERETPYTDVARTVSAGDRILLYSDGLTEGVTPNGRPFGSHGVTRYLRRSAALPSDAIVAELLGAVTTDDDLTVVMMEIQR